MNAGYHSIEGLLIARIKAAVPAISNRVYAAADMAGIHEAQGKYPHVQVIDRGHRIPASLPRGQAHLLGRIFWVVVVHKNEKSQASGVDARAALDTTIDTLLGGLVGYKLADNYTELSMVEGPEPDTSAGGVVYTPFAFECRRTFSR
jgi:hypothetical protein